jgi:hypothetical protein
MFSLEAAMPGADHSGSMRAELATHISLETILRPRELNGFQGFHRFSPNPNIYNKPGNLLSLKQQLRRLQQIGFGHSFGTAKKQGRSRRLRARLPVMVAKSGPMTNPRFGPLCRGS